MRTIGGTLVPRILGMSKWGGPLSAYYELTQGMEADREAPMVRGNILEESVLRLWLERTGLDADSLVRPVEPTRAAAMPYAHARLDAWHVKLETDPPRHTLTLLDAKTVAVEHMGDDWGPDLSDRVPADYQLQLLWYHGVCREAGLHVEDEAHLPTLVAPESEMALLARLVERTGRPLTMADLEGTRAELRVYRVLWDEALFRSVRSRVERFLREHIEAGKPPEPGDGDLAARDLKAVARGITSKEGEVLDFAAMHPAAQATVAELLEATRERKRWTELEEQAKARVQLVMGSAEEIRGLDGGARVTWKTRQTGVRVFQVHEPRRK